MSVSTTILVNNGQLRSLNSSKLISGQFRIPGDLSEYPVARFPASTDRHFNYSPTDWKWLHLASLIAPIFTHRRPSRRRPHTTYPTADRR